MKIFILSLMFSSLGFAQSVGPQDVEPMLQQMQASGQITQEQLKATRELMKKMDSSHWAEIEQRAKDCVSRNPALADKIEKHGTSAMSLEDCPAK